MTKKIHFLFAGGVGVSAVAALAKAAGYEVSACENLDPGNDFFSNLKKHEVVCFDSSGTDHLKGVDLLVVSAGTKTIDPTNPEVEFAEKTGVPVLIAEKFLAEFLLKEKFVIAVAGTNGKSTTTAMIAKILEEAGFDPSVFVGATVPVWKANFRFGKSKYFVIEADEYLDKFLLYNPSVEVVTSIEFDHPDFFSDKAAVQKSFEKFGLNLVKEGKIFLGPKVKLEANQPAQQQFQPKKLNLKVPGEFNQQNAALAQAVTTYLGIAEEASEKSLEGFAGIGRRFDFKGEAQGVKVFDDYAHHPAAVEATLRAAREKFPGAKIWCVFQPHTFTRLEAMFEEFVAAFNRVRVDETIFLPVFGSREKMGTVSSQDLTKKVKGAKFMNSQEVVATYLTKNANFGDVVLLVGAGDIVKLSSLLLTKLENKA